jgi:hypothetical protein
VDDPRYSGPGVSTFRRTTPVVTVYAPAGDPGRDDPHGGLSPGELFTVLWEALADVLGTAAAATLLRRSAKRAEPRWPELSGLAFTRERLEHRYAVPAAWKDAATPPRALCALVQELWALLVDLTGPVVVDRLAQIPELRDRNVVPPSESRA